MSAPQTHDPLVVTTKDGVTWLRRAVTQDGHGLYAVTDSCTCPEYLMATLAELAEHGIRGQADALPVPVGPEPQADRRSAAEVRLEQYGDERRTYGNGSEKALHQIALDLRGTLSDQRLYDQRLREQHDVTELELLRTRVAELEAQAAVVAEFVADRADYIVAIRNCHPDNDHDYNRWQGHAESRRQLAQKLGLPVAWPPKDAAAAADRLTRFFTPTQALREDEAGASSFEERAARETGSGRRTAGRMLAADEPEDVSPQLQTFGALLAGQRTAVEDPHDSPLHHDWRLGRDLPETGGAR